MAQHNIENYPSSGEESYAQGEATTTSKLQNLIFKVITGLFVLFLLVAFNLVFLLIVISWLPDAAWLAILSDPGDPADLSHRLHNSILPVTTWSVLIGTVVQLYRPQDRLAPLLMALAVPVIFALVELATGTYTVMGTGPFLFPLVLIALLHPRARELVRVRQLDGVMAGLTGLAAVAWFSFAYGQVQLQRLASPGDSHAEMEHWNLMAVLAILIIVWGLIGASDRPGWRLVAWVAGLASAWYGFQSLLFPAASAAPLPWAVAAIIWAVVYVIVAERRARSAALTGTEGAAPMTSGR